MADYLLSCAAGCVSSGACFGTYTDGKGVEVTAETGQMYNYMNENGYVVSESSGLNSRPGKKGSSAGGKKNAAGSGVHT
jgi:hypothetical protein